LSHKAANSQPLPAQAPHSILTASAQTCAAGLLPYVPAVMSEMFLDELPDELLIALPYLFEHWALPHQLPPAGDWRSWIILGGRGAGKTRAGGGLWQTMHT